MERELITNEELVEGFICYTMLWKSRDEDELYLATRWALGRTEDEAREIANELFLESLVMGISRVKVVPIINAHTRLALPMQIHGSLMAMPVDVLVIGGPRFDDYAAEAKDSIAETLREKREQNRATHTNIELVGEGELASCKDCGGGEIELWEQSCKVRQSMRKLGIDR